MLRGIKVVSISKLLACFQTQGSLMRRRTIFFYIKTEITEAFTDSLRLLTKYSIT